MKKYIDAKVMAEKDNEEFEKAWDETTHDLDFDKEALEKLRIAHIVVQKQIEKSPAADVAPVVHAHWNLVNEENTTDQSGNPVYHIECSACGQIWSDPYTKSAFKRCFNCGALMDRNDEDNE